MNNLIKNVKLWINNDENNITKLISEFVLNEFSETTQKAITDYLRQKYQVFDLTILAQKIEQEIFTQELQQFSILKFWLTSTYRNNIVKMSTISVPLNSSPIVNAAVSYKMNNAGEFIIRKSGVTDKISMLRFYSGLPLYAYQDIQELESAYYADKIAGKHLYETEAEDWGIKLPSPLPDSFNTGFRNELIQNRNDKIKVVFEQAREKGIVYEDQPNRWVIACAELFNPDTFIDEMGL